ncbi:3-deoxy-D-manno-octulosonate cytidylyltransferase [Lojkania enalia]|uniref:3-deoxy-manno-octulosonate cytidylyltransferase n=1 Tax=Lojkania enalia TaxID=147567 RepID=A0A9P4N4K3_9PLEO|nr:3-deoxy-D-manno-octulosonate cytidylyltransferase [Didymosphaeria enalia]
MKFIVVIPARYASTRLPGKPLKDINGKTMIAHVISRAKLSGATTVIVATDHDDIASEAKRHGAEPCLTGSHHLSGTERLMEVVENRQFPDDLIIVNVQGDEPLINPEHIRQVAEDHVLSAGDMVTLATPISSSEEMLNPNIVKTVLDAKGFALYFSRAPIPWDRDGGSKEVDGLEKQFLRHIGLYAYSAGFLRRYSSWKPTLLERIEALEQLRVLWYGGRIHVAVTLHDQSISVDTPEDLERVRLAMEDN